MLRKAFHVIFRSKYSYIGLTLCATVLFFLFCAQVSVFGLQQFSQLTEVLSAFIHRYKLLFAFYHLVIIVAFYLLWDYKIDRVKKANNLPESRVKGFRQLKWLICGLFALFSFYLYVILGV